MIRDQFLLDIAPELIVDNFAGGGGASCGIELALGRHVDIAINHDPEAVAMHAMNHPQTDHHCESVWDVNPLAVTRGRPVGLAWFSPDCKHFSKAKGGKPRDKRIRGLAWVALRWAALARPRVIILENVEEFQTWGPLLADGNPCPRRRGDTFRSFVRQLQEKGYAVEWRELRACDFGAPTIRKRLFLIARCDGQPVVWPEPTHGAPDSAAVKAKRLRPWRTAAECIDWSIKPPSIFERERPLAEATQRRIARGLRRYVINSADPFIVKVNHGGDDFRGQRLAEPIQTITGKHGYGLVAPVLTECANASTQRTFRADEPLRTQCAEVKGGHFALAAATLVQTGYGERPGQAPRAPGLDKPLGTVVAGGAKHALVSAFLAKHYGGNYEGPGVSLADPASTITTTDHHALVSSHMVKMYGTTTGSEAGAPMPTVTSGGNHIGEVRAFLVKYYSEGGQDQDCRNPMHTIPTKDRLGLVTVAGEQYQIADIGMRMLEPHELYAAQGFPSSYVIAPVINGRRLPKHAQVRMCGNSVSPPMAAALVRANLPDLASWSPTEVKLMREAA
ncbi:DNA cytosine methyltransferase [Ralstonia pseudosolanacearum]|uniref:DNA cytosine methyltransferase n=1 Tax=Ralstonia pseudosolanacearum TaxID=1310165 RepID=UPI001C8B15BE|nr:DNA cytosine methyltransferase [Ralstonia pseudosolanacearum]MBX9427954.1 DNA cytosine methyltransferase [Ralstonia pseudosolanacearum]